MEDTDKENSKAGNSAPHSSDPTEAQHPQSADSVDPSDGVDAPIAARQQMGIERVRLICPSCQAQVVTRIEWKPTIKTHLITGLLCITGLWCCVCVPYWKDCFHNAYHYCPNCNVYIGSHLDSD